MTPQNLKGRKAAEAERPECPNCKVAHKLNCVHDQGTEGEKRWTICGYGGAWPLSTRGTDLAFGERIDVIPADSPNVLSKEEARRWVEIFDAWWENVELAVTDEDHALRQSLSDWAGETESGRGEQS